MPIRHKKVEDFSDKIADIVTEALKTGDVKVGMIQAMGIVAQAKDMKDIDNAIIHTVVRLLQKILLRNPEMIDLMFEGVAGKLKHVILDRLAGAKDAGEAQIETETHVHKGKKKHK